MSNSVWDDIKPTYTLSSVPLSDSVPSIVPSSPPLLFDENHYYMPQESQDFVSLISAPQENTSNPKNNLNSSVYVYKPVQLKVKPVPAVYPEDARVVQQFPEDPLLSLPPLSQILQNLFLQKGSLMNIFLSSISIKMASYGLKKRSYFSKFSRTMRKF